MGAPSAGSRSGSAAERRVAIPRPRRPTDTRKPEKAPGLSQAWRLGATHGCPHRPREAAAPGASFRELRRLEEQCEMSEEISDSGGKSDVPNGAGSGITKRQTTLDCLARHVCCSSVLAYWVLGGRNITFSTPTHCCRTPTSTCRGLQLGARRAPHLEGRREPGARSPGSRRPCAPGHRFPFRGRSRPRPSSCLSHAAQCSRQVSIFFTASRYATDNAESRSCKPGT